MSIYKDLKEFFLPPKAGVGCYMYLLRGSGGQEISVRGRFGTLEEASRLAKTTSWVLSYPVRVWCREGQERPDATKEPTGVIHDPRPRPLVIVPKADVVQPTETTTEDASDLKVDFASAKAAELADSLNLTTTDFAGMEPSGKTGYTKADVERAAGQHEESET